MIELFAHNIFECYIGHSVEDRRLTRKISRQGREKEEEPKAWFERDLHSP